VRLGLGLVVGVAASWLFANAGQAWSFVLKRPGTRGQLAALRAVAGLGGLLVIYGILRSSGFATAIDAAFGAVRTAYGAMIEGSLGTLPNIVAALQGGDPAAIRQAFYPMLESPSPSASAAACSTLGPRANCSLERSVRPLSATA
jgi:hypothetical protein